MSSTNKVIHAKDTFCYRHYVCEVSKITTYVCNRFHTPFSSKDHKHTRQYSATHKASRGEGKNSLRKRRDILVSDHDLQFFFIILP